MFAQPLAPADLCGPSGTWSVLRPPGEDHPQVAGIFESIVFPTPDIGYVRARDGLLIKTEDGGRTWRDVDAVAPHWPQAVACPDERTCYAVASDATILKSTDGGQRWRVLTTGLAALYDLLDGSHLPHRDKDMRGHSRMADSEC